MLNFRHKGWEYRCVNCGYHAKFNFGQYDGSAKSLPEIEQQILASWLPEIEDFSEHIVCKECLRILEERAAEVRGGGLVGERARGHAPVCAGCGDTLLRARKCRLRNLAGPAYEYIAPCLYRFYQDDEIQYICFACYRKAYRYPKPKPNDQKNDDLDDEDIESDVKDQGSTDQIKTESTDQTKTALVRLSYFKLEDKGTICAADCQRDGIKRASLRTRQQLIIRQKLYVPGEALVCTQHQHYNTWKDTTRQKGVFSPEEIVDMLFLLKHETPVNFTDLQNIDKYLLRRWIGVSLEKFQELFENCSLKDKSGGGFALAVFLCKMHTKEHERVIASLCQRSVEKVRAALELARKCVDKEAIRSALEACKHEEIK